MSTLVLLSLVGTLISFFSDTVHRYEESVVRPVESLRHAMLGQS